MALEFKKDGRYVKIDIDGSFITKNGIYIGEITYASKEDRDREKRREAAVKSFISRIRTAFLEAESLEEGDLKEETYTKLYKAAYVADNLDRIITTNDLEGKIVDFPELKDEYIVEAEKFGFSRNWMENPVRIISVSSRLLADYEGQPFDLETFYPIFKNAYISDDEPIEDV